MFRIASIHQPDMPTSHLPPSVLLFLLISLVKTPGYADEIDFAHEVVPILKKRCAECHSNGTYKGGFSIDNRQAFLKSGHAIPRQPTKSELISRIHSNDPDEQMPPEGDRLTPMEIATLTRWIESGIPWEPGFSFQKQKWQAPIGPRRPPLPKGPGNPIDRIVNQYFSSHKIRWPDTVSDDQFYRRVNLDLIGLPPDQKELQRFLSDPKPNKRVQLIRDVLSQNVHYADHWLTFWNDHLRNDYVGTGYIDGGRKQISSWLYQSLHDNKPFDQFARELISPSTESEGFIRGIQWRGNVNASQVRELQFAQSISQVFLGENIKCASCHDSFINDWKLTDAYGLAAIIADRPLEMFQCDKPTGKTAVIKFLWPELGSIDGSLSKSKRLERTAHLITKPENGRFARTIVNRLWKRMMGRGLVEPVDMMANRPWDEDLLDFLAIDLADNHYDLKKTMSLIANSNIYQSKSRVQNQIPDVGYTFKGPIARRLTAEQFLDSIHRITQTVPRGKRVNLPLFTGNQAEQSKAVLSSWIWSQPDSNRAFPGEVVQFHSTWESKQNPPNSVLTVTCDNSYQLTINGKPVKKDDHWETIESINLTSYLKKGTNQIRIQATNLGNTANPAGLYVSLISNRQHQQLTWMVKEGQSSRPAVVLKDQQIWQQVHAKINQQEQIALTQKQPVQLRVALTVSDPLMRSLGRPNREQIVTTRDDQLSTLQALDLSNGQILMEILERGAGQLINKYPSPDKLANHVYQTALSRKPSLRESDVIASILGQKLTRESVADFLWSVIMLPEFQYVR